MDTQQSEPQITLRNGEIVKVNGKPRFLLCKWLPGSKRNLKLPALQITSTAVRVGRFVMEHLTQSRESCSFCHRKIKELGLQTAKTVRLPREKVKAARPGRASNWRGITDPQTSLTVMSPTLDCSLLQYTLRCATSAN